MALGGPSPCRDLTCDALYSLRLRADDGAVQDPVLNADAPQTPRWGIDHTHSSNEEDIVDDFLSRLQAKLPCATARGLSTSGAWSSTRLSTTEWLHHCGVDVEVYPQRPREQMASLGSTECSDDLAERSVSSSVGESTESWTAPGAASESKQAILRSVARHWGNVDLPQSLSRIIDMSMSTASASGKPPEKVKLPPPIPLDLCGLADNSLVGRHSGSHIGASIPEPSKPDNSRGAPFAAASKNSTLTPVAIACPYCLRDSLQPCTGKLSMDATWKCSCCSCSDDPAAQTCSLCLRQVCVACSRAGACREGLDVRCQAGHILWPLPTKRGPDGQWTCSKCFQEGTELPGAVRHRCPACEVDMCELCLGRLTHKHSGQRPPLTPSLTLDNRHENAEAFAILHNQVGVKLMREAHNMEAAYAYMDALHSLHMRCFGVPSSTVLYNKTCCLCLSLKSEGAGQSTDGSQDASLELALHLLLAAVEAGYSHADHMAKDLDLEVLRTQRPFAFMTILRRAKHRV
mmetsp:Transcript_60247/g.135631  ORF Transcript_60247/g.135631 Transcript_60247/m.135631 type:complete len:517 (-) Transcript_60247:73-1623(-)